MKKTLFLLLFGTIALWAPAQNKTLWGHLDTLISEYRFATAYPLAQQAYRPWVPDPSN